MFLYISPCRLHVLTIDAAKKHSPSRESKNPVSWSMWKCPWQLNPLQNVHANDCQKIIRKKKIFHYQMVQTRTAVQIWFLWIPWGACCKVFVPNFQVNILQPNAYHEGFETAFALWVFTMSTNFTGDVTACVFNGFSIAALYDWKHLLVLGHSRCVCTIVRTKQWFLHLARCFVEQPLGGSVGRCQCFVSRNTCRRIIAEK